jgi:hypothetical protein
VRGTLDDERVLLVTTPQTPADLAERLTPLLEQAGAQVTGTLQLLPALADPAQRALVEDLVAQVVPAGVELPETGAVERATTELAAALTRTAEGEGVEPRRRRPSCRRSPRPTRRVRLVEPTLQPATLAVVLTGPAPEQLTPPGRCSSWRPWRWPGRSTRARRAPVVAGPSGSAVRPGPVRVLRSTRAGRGGVVGRQRRPRHRAGGPARAGAPPSSGAAARAVTAPVKAPDGAAEPAGAVTRLVRSAAWGAGLARTGCGR